MGGFPLFLVQHPLIVSDHNLSPPVYHFSGHVVCQLVFLKPQFFGENPSGPIAILGAKRVTKPRCGCREAQWYTVDSPGCQEDDTLLEVHTRTFGKMFLEIPEIVVFWLWVQLEFCWFLSGRDSSVIGVTQTYQLYLVVLSNAACTSITVVFLRQMTGSTHAQRMPLSYHRNKILWLRSREYSIWYHMI